MAGTTTDRAPRRAAATGATRGPGPDESPRCCPGMGRAAIGEDDAAALATAFRALGDPVRLRLLSLIAAADDEICVCDLTDGFTVSGPTVSHHLKVLRQAGLVTSRRRGTWVYYRAQPAALRRLGALLAPDAVPAPPTI